MKTALKLFLCVLVGSFSVSVFASTQTIHFDDLPHPGPGGAPIPNGYQGLNWNNFYYFNGNDLPGTGYQNGIVSCCNVAFDAFATGAAFSLVGGGTFQLDSAYFTSAGSDQLGEVEAVLGGNLVGDFFFQELVSGPTFVNFGGITVDEVTVVGTLVSQNVMDDLTITTGGTPIPEPTSLMLLGTGVLALGAKLRSRLG